MDKSYIIFGAGKWGHRYFEEYKDSKNIVAFCDNNEALWGSEMCGVPVIAPGELSAHNESTLIVACAKHYEVVLQLFRQGVKEFTLYCYENKFTPVEMDFRAYDNLDIKANSVALIEEWQWGGHCLAIKRFAEVSDIDFHYFGNRYAFTKNSESYYKYLTSSLVLADLYAPDGKPCIVLWHGFTVKAIVHAANGKGWAKNSAFYDKCLTKSLAICSYSDLYTHFATVCFGENSKNKFRITGAPRNDILLKSTHENNLEKIFPSARGRKIVLYAPTFRKTPELEYDLSNGLIFAWAGFDENDLTEFLEDNNAMLIIRTHPQDISNFNIYETENIKVLSDDVLEQNGLHFYEVASAADCLIADYSSFWVDFLLLNKPIIFAVKDLEEYDKANGLMMKPFEAWIPGELVTDMPGLSSAISDALAGDDKYKSKREFVTNIFHEYKDANSSQRVVELVRELITPDLDKESIMNEKAVVIFGAGKRGKATLEWLRSEQFMVLAFCDNNPALWGKDIENVKVVSPIQLSQLNGIRILIANNFAQIKSQLEEQGIQNFISADYFKLKYKNALNGLVIPGLPTNQLCANWLVRHFHQGAGVAPWSGSTLSYPEVTGYTIPTLLDYGFKQVALEATEWLNKIAGENGEFTDMRFEKVYCFDTAQVLRGLNAISKITNEFEILRHKTANYLFSVLKQNNGRFTEIYTKESAIPEAINLFSLPPMLVYAMEFRRDDLAELVNIAADAYLGDADALKTSTLTHFLAYQIDGLIDIGREDAVANVVAILINKFEQTGEIEAFDGSKWVCLTGMSQLAICLYKLGFIEIADKIMEYLDTKIEDDGGFLGSIGNGAGYFPDSEISWAVKFYLDAYLLRIETHFDGKAVPVNEGGFPDDISETDPEILAVSSEIITGCRVAEIGCGKGRFIKRLHEKFPECQFTGVDISGEMLKNVPIYAQKLKGKSENIPLSTGEFDIVYCVECIEHSVNLVAAVAELVRIARTGGKVIIIDKHEDAWGRFECPPWERWPKKSGLCEMMMLAGLTDVKARKLFYENRDDEDDVIWCWTGVKN